MRWWKKRERICTLVATGLKMQPDVSTMVLAATKEIQEQHPVGDTPLARVPWVGPELRRENHS